MKARGRIPAPCFPSSRNQVSSQAGGNRNSKLRRFLTGLWTGAAGSAEPGGTSGNPADLGPPQQVYTTDLRPADDEHLPLTILTPKCLKLTSDQL